MANTVVTLHGINDLRIEKLPLPDLESDEVLIRTSKLGICGSDLAIVYTGEHGDKKVGFPSGIGHEVSGTVIKCGSEAKDLKEGDRVAFENGSYCRVCDLCLSGKHNVCTRSSFHHSPPFYPGCLARYYKDKAHHIHKLPDSISDEEGAVLEPLAVAVHACHRTGVWGGSNVLVTGAGSVGLLCLTVAKALCATNILITDIKESRLGVAKRMGADHTLLVDSGDAQSQAQKVWQKMGCMPDITLECSGVQAGITLAIYATKSGGKMAQIGVGPVHVSVPLAHAGVREVDILGVYRYGNCFPIAIDLLAKKLVDVKPLITHRFEFEDFQKAFDTARSGKDGAIKCMISC